MEIFKELNYFYLISAVIVPILFVLVILDYSREKAISKVLLVLKHDMFWWAVLCFSVLMIAMFILMPKAKLHPLNKILITLIEIYAVLLIVLDCLIKTVITTKGIEMRLIKGRTKVLIKWSDIIEWSVLSEYENLSLIKLNYRYKYKGRIKKAKMKAWGNDKERLIEIFKQHVI